MPSLTLSPLSLSLSLLPLLAICLLPQAQAFLAQQPPLRIDCGADAFTSATVGNGTTVLAFQPDTQYATSGVPMAVPGAEQYGLNQVESTLRYFPSDATSCYNLSVAAGRYLMRLGWAYYNYNGLNQPPRFALLLQGTVVETVDMGAVQALYTRGAYYSDHIAFALGGSLGVCFQPMQSTTGGVGAPFVNSLEVLPVDTDAYDATRTGQGVILSTYLRLNLGGPALGPEPADPGFRMWGADVNETEGQYQAVTLPDSVPIRDTQGPPDYLPQGIFRSCRQATEASGATGFRMTIVPLDKSNSWYLRFYFAEPLATARQGQRVFQILLGSGSVFNTIGDEAQGFDILAKANGPQAALAVPVFFNFSQYLGNFGQDLEVGVKTVEGSALQALICGVEVYEIIPVVAVASSTPASKKGLSGGQIALLVLAILLAAVLLAALAVFIIRRRRPPGSNFVPLGAQGEMQMQA